jgi:hypothetical protein
MHLIFLFHHETDITVTTALDSSSTVRVGAQLEVQFFEERVEGASTLTKQHVLLGLSPS